MTSIMWILAGVVLLEILTMRRLYRMGEHIARLNREVLVLTYQLDEVQRRLRHPAYRNCVIPEVDES